jgi:Mn2+/Fe2+ NRAMP family transporter
MQIHPSTRSVAYHGPVTALERALLSVVAAVCFLSAGFFVWWAIVVAGKAFEPYQDNTDAVYLSIAAMGALLGAAAVLLASMLVVRIDSRQFRRALAMAAAVLAVIPRTLPGWVEWH